MSGCRSAGRVPPDDGLVAQLERASGFEPEGSAFEIVARPPILSLRLAGRATDFDSRAARFEPWRRDRQTKAALADGRLTGSSSRLDQALHGDGGEDDRRRLHRKVKRGEPEKKAMWTAVRAISGAATIQISRWRRPIHRPPSARISSGNRRPMTRRTSAPRGALRIARVGPRPPQFVERGQPLEEERSRDAPGQTRNRSARDAPICPGVRPGGAAGIASVLMLVTASSRLRPAVGGRRHHPARLQDPFEACTMPTASRASPCRAAFGVDHADGSEQQH